MASTLESIKCPQCGETNMNRVNDAEYRCPVCDSCVRDNKVQEILDILKNSPENFIGNLRFRLRTELAGAHTDFALVASLADKILDEKPDDVLARFYFALAKREENHGAYKNKLLGFAEEALEPYQLRQIANTLVRFYEPYAYGETETFFQKQDAAEYLAQLSAKAEEYRRQAQICDPTLQRDVMILAGEGDVESAQQVCAWLESDGLSCFEESRNYDGFSDRENVLFTAAENCKTVLLLYSAATVEDRVIGSVVNRIASSKTASILTSCTVLTLDATALPNAAFYKQAKLFDGEKEADLSEVSKTLSFLCKAWENRGVLEVLGKLAEAEKLLDNGNSGRAIRVLEELLESDFDQKTVRKLLLRAHVEEGIENTHKAQFNFEWLKKHCEAAEFAALENAYPCFIDEEKEYACGMEKFKNRMFAEALPYFVKAAKKQHVDALCKLGDIYFAGRGVGKDQAKGLAFYSLAAQGGSADANRMLGMAYTMGNGVAKNEEKAFEHFLAGASAGNAFCQCKAAACYEKGVGTRVSLVKAFEMYRKAAEQGVAEAICNLGFCYKYGKGTEVNANYARQCFMAASEKGDLDAKREICGF